MMGRQGRDQRQLFYEFSLDEMIPTDHLLRRINVFATAVLADLHEQLKAFYSDIGRPSVDPELMIRMLLVGYCYGIRHERRLCQEVALHLAYRWFCKLDLDDKVPHHSTFSVNRLGRFRESEILRHIFERVVTQCMAAGLVKGEGFAVDASVMEANASRYHGKAPDELDWSDAQRQKRAVAEYLAGLEAEAQVQEGGNSRGAGSDGKPTAKPDRKPPKVISPSDPSSAWTAKARGHAGCDHALEDMTQDLALPEAGSPRTSNGAEPCRRDRACRTSGKQGAAPLPGTAGAHDECHSSNRPGASGSSARGRPRAGRCRCKTPLAVRANRQQRLSRTH